MSIPTGSLLPRVRDVQPCCANIQVFIRLLSTFHPELQQDSCTTYLNVKKQLDHPGYQPRKRLGLRTMRLLGVVVKRSNSVEKSSKVEKPQRPRKSAKVIDSEEPSFLTSDTRLALIKMGSSCMNLTMKNYRPPLKKPEVLVFSEAPILRQWDTKSSSSRQVHCT